MGLIQQLRAMRRFQNLPSEHRRIVFYSQEPGHWVHLEPILNHLINDHDQTICYLSSASGDPGLAQNDSRVLPFNIGEGTARTALFCTMRAGVMVMTMPELDCYAIKRSAYPVHYCYVHHSLVSSHMVYRPGAFDHFDSIFCAGPHHEMEIRRMEELEGLKQKELFPHGYGRLDAILMQARARPAPKREVINRPSILIAPSWGPTCILETIADKLIQVLIDADFQVTVRPHPETRKLTPKVLDNLLAQFGKYPNFSCEHDVVSQDSLHSADLMISDWSGAALEFAFGLERPILFIDVAHKVRNPNYQRLNIVPFEEMIRSEIGSIVSPEALDCVPQRIETLISKPGRFKERIKALRNKWVYNVGQSGARGSDRILELTERYSKDVSDQA
jgi:YidC/Oxa1 family membrane protein insertase